MINNYFLSVLFILFISCKEQNFTKSPNVILIITDDQGYGDLGINKNSKFIIELNQKVYSKSILSFDNEDFIELKNIRVDEGKYSLIPFLRNGNKNLLPFYLEIEKIN